MALDRTFKPFSGVGIITLAPRDALTGLPNGGAIDLGEGSKLSLSQQSPKLELNTSRSSDRGVAFTMAQSRSGDVAIELRTLSDPVLALLTQGAWTETAAGAAVVGWTAPTGLTVGEVIQLPAQNLSAVVVKDSAGSPATVPITKYDLDAAAGTIKLLDVTGYTQPFKVDYTPGAIKTLGAFKAPTQDFVMRFAGTNSYDGERVTVEVYKFRFAAEGELALIETEFGTYQLNGSIQKDETKAANSAGGQYYKMVKAGA